MDAVGVSRFFSAWTFDAFIAVNLLLVAGGYLWAVQRLNRTDRDNPWRTRHSAFFLAGVGLLALVYLGPIAAWSHTFFWAHMTQHLVVMMVAAPLIVLGNPITLLFRASPESFRKQRLEPILNGRVVRLLTNPVFTWLLFAGVLIGIHFSPFYNWSLTNHDLGQFVEQPLFLVAALLFYVPLIGSNVQPNRPSPAFRLAAIALMMIPEALVGAVIYFAPVVLYPQFAIAGRPFGVDPLAEQQFAGALMWALVMVVDSFWMMLAAADWFASEEARSKQVDAEIAAELVAGRK